MVWRDLLFAHWPIPIQKLRARVPAGLSIDTFHGAAWIGVIPFHMTGVSLRGLPNLGIASRFAEMNVRSYVLLDDKPGVWFFSLDAASRLAAWVARRWYRLAYRHARMIVGTDGDWVRYRSEHCGERLVVRYRPRGEVFTSGQNDLEHWLTERYCLYAESRRGTILRADIHHAPWPLQRAELRVEENTMLDGFGVDTSATAPHLLFARRLDTLAWSPEPARCD